MQFRDLNRQYQHLKTKIDGNIKEVIESSSFILGKHVLQLENELAKYVGRKHCISCANGTDALVLALKCYNIGPGDAVFVPDFTYIASAFCVSLVGGTPIFVDIDDRTFNMDSVSLENEIKYVLKKGVLKPKAIIPVDLFGQPADFDALCKIAKKYNLVVVEDAAQGFGGNINNKKACSFGDISCTSFFPAKPLGCYGDGGAIFTDDDKIAERLRSIRAGGKSPIDKYDNREIGTNSRLDTIQAAILLPKFEAFKDYELREINNAALKYTEILKEKIQTPVVLNGFYSSWAQYCVLLDSKEQRERVQKALKEKEIPSMIYYPRGMHQQACFADMKLDSSRYPNTCKIIERILAIPIHPYLNKDEIELICDTLIKAL